MRDSIASAGRPHLAEVLLWMIPEISLEKRPTVRENGRDWVVGYPEFIFQ
jgi:hypothetical protein